jgi:hypothetical protein
MDKWQINSGHAACNHTHWHIMPDGQSPSPFLHRVRRLLDIRYVLYNGTTVFGLQVADSCADAISLTTIAQYVSQPLPRWIRELSTDNRLLYAVPSRMSSVTTQMNVNSKSNRMTAVKLYIL